MARGGACAVAGSPAFEHRKDAVGQVQRRARIAVLVGDDSQLVAALGERHHGLQEILAEGAVDPGRAQDGMVRIGGPHLRLVVDVPLEVG